MSMLRHESGALLITGAEDTTAVLWFLAPPSVPKHTTVPQPLRALRGHVREISAVAVSAPPFAILSVWFFLEGEPRRKRSCSGKIAGQGR